MSHRPTLNLAIRRYVQKEANVPWGAVGGGLAGATGAALGSNQEDRWRNAMLGGLIGATSGGLAGHLMRGQAARQATKAVSKVKAKPQAVPKTQGSPPKPSSPTSHPSKTPQGGGGGGATPNAVPPNQPSHLQLGSGSPRPSPGAAPKQNVRPKQKSQLSDEQQAQQARFQTRRAAEAGRNATQFVQQQGLKFKNPAEFKAWRNQQLFASHPDKLVGSGGAVNDSILQVNQLQNALRQGHVTPQQLGWGAGKYASAEEAMFHKLGASAWIKRRAEHIYETNEDLRSKSAEGKSIAFALATQQAHRLGKSKKSERTAQGMKDAVHKYSKPHSEYKKTASGSGMPAIPTPQFPSGLQKITPKSVKAGPVKPGKAQSTPTYSQVHTQPPAVNNAPFQGAKAVAPTPVR